MDARMLSGLDADLRLRNWPLFMQLLMSFPIRRALMPSFKQNNTRTHARVGVPTVCGKVHAPSDTTITFCRKGVNSHGDTLTRTKNLKIKIETF